MINSLFFHNEYHIGFLGICWGNSVAPKRAKTRTNVVHRRLIDAHEAGLTYKRMSQLLG